MHVVEATKPSVPTRYQQHAHQGSYKKGFQTSSKRSSGSNVIPGPGKYYNMSSLVRDSHVCGSVSKKGFGIGFVSNTVRFSDVIHDESLPPGPGQYDVKVLNSKKDFSVSSSFSNSKKSAIEKSSTPGPGHYEVRLAKVNNTSSLPQASRNQIEFFMSPAPGAYHKPMPYSTSGHVSSFASNTQRGQPKAMLQVPGPGAYDTNSKPRSVQNQKPQHSEPISKPALTTPGPGTYDTYEPKPASNSTSVFKSTSAKTCSNKQTTTPPGPAFYKPATNLKRSFHLNATRAWI